MSGYTGQGANAFVQGLQQGYGFVEDARNSKQSREIKAQQASQAAASHSQQLQSNQYAIDKQGMQVEGMQELREEMQSSKAELKEMQGKETKQFMNSYTSAEGAENQRAELSRWANSMPESVQKAMGIQNVKTARVATMEDKKDIFKVLSSQGVDVSKFDDATTQAIVDSGLYVSIDGEVKDMAQIAMVSGAGKLADPKQQKAFEKKQQAIQEASSKAFETAEVSKAAEERQLKEKITSQATQLAGVSGQQDNRTQLEKNMEFMMEDGNYDFDAAYDKLKKTSGSEQKTLYKEMEMAKIQALVAKGVTGDDFDDAIATWRDNYATSKSSGVATVVANTHKQDIIKSQSIGADIIKDGNYVEGTGGASREAEAAFSETKTYDKKEVANFKLATESTKSAFSAADRAIKSIDNGELAYDITKTIKQKVMTNTPNGFKDMANSALAAFGAGEIDETEMANRIGVTGEMSLVIGKMVKAYYGGNASDKDRQSFIDGFGIESWDNTSTVKAKMQNMKEVLAKQYRIKADGMIEGGYTYTGSKGIEGVFGFEDKPKTETKQPSNAEVSLEPYSTKLNKTPAGYDQMYHKGTNTYKLVPTKELP